MDTLIRNVRTLQLVVMSLVALNLYMLISAFRYKNDGGQTFDEITVGRINLVDKQGVLKLAISSNDHWKELRETNGNEIPAFSGMLFYNQEGQECGGLIYRGKKTKNGQESGAGLMFDQFNQDQNIALQHSESVDSLESSVDDGLTLNQRPDYRKMQIEFKTYGEIDKMDLTKEQKDSVKAIYANQGIIFSRRLFLGVKRGTKDNKPFNETGLFIRNKAGNQAIRLYVDNDNLPHFEVYDPSGRKRIYELDLKEKQ